MRRKIRNEHIAWQKYKQWQFDNPEKIREGQEITSLSEFKVIYNEAGRNISKIKQEVMYQTSYKTYLSLKKAYKEKFGEDLPYKRREARQKSTKEIAVLLNTEIKEFYAQARASGMTAKQAKLEVSAYYFGS